MTQYNERWLTDGAGVPSGWTNSNHLAGTFSGSVTNNALTQPSTTASSVLVKYDAADNFTDTDQLATFVLQGSTAFYNQASGVHAFGLVARAAGTAAGSNTVGYWCTLSIDGLLGLFKASGAAALTALTPSVNILSTLGVDIKNNMNGMLICLRFQVSGTTIRAKAWKWGNSEPGSWTISATDATVAGTGFHGIYKKSSTESLITHAYHITDDAATANFDTVSGTISTEGSPSARTTCLIQRITRLLASSTTSNGTTGAYSLPTPFGGEHNVVVLDTATTDPLRNDLIHRVMPQ